VELSTLLNLRPDVPPGSFVSPDFGRARGGGVYLEGPLCGRVPR